MRPFCKATTTLRVYKSILIFYFYFFVVFNGDVRNRTEGLKNRGDKTTYLSSPKRGRNLGK
nr:MAG TPA: hypothetical protein [Caudoviricetes sp.]